MEKKGRKGEGMGGERKGVRKVASWPEPEEEPPVPPGRGGLAYVMGLTLRNV